ncbi:uncharacterized protein LOC142348149 isoform X3 [Convolutriloba macropyga]
MSFPNRTTYDEAINDLKRKLQQQEYNLTNSSSPSLNNNYSNSLRQSSSTISEIGIGTNNFSQIDIQTSKDQSCEVSPNTNSISTQNHENNTHTTPTVTFKFSPVLNRKEQFKESKQKEKELNKMPILTSLKESKTRGQPVVENQVDDDTENDESESQDESSLVYRNVVNDVRKTAGNSQSDADVLKLMLKERDELLKDYAIKLNEAEMESRSNAKKTRTLELEKQRMEKQMKEFQKALDDELQKRDSLETKMSDMQYTMKDLETKASIHMNCDPEKDFLQSSLNEVTEENENLRSSLQSKCELIQTLNNQFENREELLAESHEQIKTKADSLQRQLMESQSSVDVKTAEMGELKEEVKELKNEIYELMIKVHEKEKLIGAVNEEYSTVQEDNAVLEEKLTKLEQDFQNKENEMLDLKQSLKDKMDKIKEHESTIGKLQDSEVEKKIRQKMRERFETEQKEMHENFKKKLKREVEAAKSQVTKELRHKHLKECHYEQDLENLRDDIESTHKTEVDLMKKEMDERYTKDLQVKLKEKETDFKRTMETYQTIIHKLESKVNECNKVSATHTETLQEVEEMLNSLVKYTAGTSQTIYLDVTALNTTEIKEAFQKLTTKIFELIDEIAYLNRQAEHAKEVRQELEAKLESYQKDFVPAYMYKQVYNEYVKSMKKREASATDSTIATVGTPINTNTIQDANLLDVLRGENLQLLEEKLTNEQKINKLELELTMLKEHQSKTEDYEKIQNELMDVRAESKAMNEMISGLKDENLFLIDQLESLSDSKAKLEEDFLVKQTEFSDSLEKKSKELKEQVVSLIEKNQNLSDKLADSVDTETVVQLQEATKELLMQNNELNVENEVLLDEISSVNAEKEKLENQLELVSQSASETDTMSIATSQSSSKPLSKRVQFNLATQQSSSKGPKPKKHSPQPQSSNNSAREIVLYRPPARDIIEKQLAQENTHLFAVNTKLFTEREKLKEELFEKNMQLNDDKMESEKEKSELRQKLNTQRLALQRLSSRVRIYSYQASSPTELELKIKRELMQLEHQISELLQNFQTESKKSDVKSERYFLYEISDANANEESSSSASDEEPYPTSEPVKDPSDRSLVQIREPNEETSDLDEKLRLTQNSIAEKNKEIEAIRSRFDQKEVSAVEKYRDREARQIIIREKGSREKEIPPHRNVTTTTMQTLNVVTVTEEHFAAANTDSPMYLVQSPGSKTSRSSWRMDLVDSRN